LTKALNCVILIWHDYKAIIPGGQVAFKEVGVKKKSTQIAEQIIEAIQKGIYKIGDKLPPERVIAEETGVSRTAVREALSALHLAGILESIPGSGTYIKRLNRGGGALAVLEESDSISDALEARRVLERSIVELVIDRADIERIKAIERVLERMRLSVEERDYDKYLDLNEEFHIAIAEATENTLIVRAIRSLLNVTRQGLWREGIKEYFLKKEENLERSFREHELMLEALKKGNKREAKELMEKHFIEVEEEFKK